MGVDCSNCRCTNRDDEKILVIENGDKINHSKPDSRKEKLDSIEKSKNAKKINIKEILAQNPNLDKKIVKLQALIRRHKHRKIYKAILKKFRVIFLFKFY